MEKRIKEYRNYMDNLLKKLEGDTTLSGAEITALENEHLRQISFFQHERLIHLIVTITFALLEMLSLILMVVSGEIFSLLLVSGILVLLVPYIRHYYILENEVQKMYAQYDRLHNLHENLPA